MGVLMLLFEMVMCGDDLVVCVIDIVVKFGLLLFVKLVSEGLSVVVLKVKMVDVLLVVFEEVVMYDKIVIVEKSIEGGGEYIVCIVGDFDLLLIKIVLVGEFYDYYVKYVVDDM